MARPKHILVLRFSALGDVAMTVPVIRLLLQQHPHVHITYVSTPFVKPLFGGIDRLTFHAIDTKGAHKGVKGLYLLKKELETAYPIDAIADLHQVLRTQILRALFVFSPKKWAAIDKGRKEKAALTRVRGKDFRPLKSTFRRYADVFEALGLPVALEATLEVPHRVVAKELADYKLEGKRLVGLAPFARHREKMYPLDRMEEVVSRLNEEGDCHLFLFGSGEEAQVLKEWEGRYSNVTSLAGKMGLGAELEWIAGLDLMVSMDSANMHLASLFGVPVISVWGATHPYAGFYGWRQPTGNAVQVDLYCRPCSVFGNRKCYRGDHACMQSITPAAVYDRIVQQLYLQKKPGS